ncbi:ABC transporter permease [Vibrio sp. E150_011]
MSSLSSSIVRSTPLSKWLTLKYKIQLMIQTPTTMIGVLLVCIFTYFIAVPVLSLLLDAIQVQFGDERRIGEVTGEWTDYYVNRTIFSQVSQSLFWAPLKHTLTVSSAVIVISLVLGSILAWLVSRTNMLGKKWFATALIVPYMLPAWTFAMAWTTTFKNRSVGGQQGWMENLGFQTPDWLAYGEVPITVILSLNYIPFVILLLGNALRSFDTQLEDSARILGASNKIIALKIIIPLMLPALMSASILIFAKVLGEFGVSYILGLPVNYEVLSTSLYRSIESRQTGVAAVLAGTIMFFGIVSLMIDTLLLKEARKFVIVGSKGVMHRKTHLGIWRLPAFGLASMVFFFSVVMPMSVLALSTFMHIPGNFSWSNFTLDYWIGTDLKTIAETKGVLLSSNLWSAVWNTLWIVGIASVCSGVLGLLVGYVVVRSPYSSMSTLLRQITFFPYLVPGIAFAAAYMSLFAVERGPMPALYGTITLLILALIADEMPYASRAGISAMMQLGKDPEEAAQMAGAGWFTRITKIVIPIQKGSLVTGILLPFISGINGLSLFVILAVPSTDVLTTYALRLIDYNYIQASNAVVLIICAIAFLGTYFTQKMTKTNLAEGLGS